MLSAWAARNWKAIVLVLVVAGLFAAGGVGFWRGLVEIGRRQDKAAAIARELQDAKWKAQIAEANAAVSAAQAGQAIASARADAATRDAEARFQEQLKQLETNDAALAGGADLVLRRDRVRVLGGARP